MGDTATEGDSAEYKASLQKCIDGRRSMISSGRFFEVYMRYIKKRVTNAERAFLKTVSEMYQGTHRAEERKRFLSMQLPTSIKAKSSMTSYLYCTKEDCARLNGNLWDLKTSTAGTLEQIKKIKSGLKNVSCRLRPTERMNKRSHRIAKNIRNLCTTFNRLIFIARAKHQCNNRSDLSNYLKDQLVRRCRENSRLNMAVYKFIKHIGAKKHRDLSTVLTGLLCQTPHIWSRSIRLLGRLKCYFQDAFIFVLNSLGVCIRDVFDDAYLRQIRITDLDIKSWSTSMFQLNPLAPKRIAALQSSRTGALPSEMTAKRNAARRGRRAGNAPRRPDPTVAAVAAAVFSEASSPGALEIALETSMASNVTLSPGPLDLSRSPSPSPGPRLPLSPAKDAMRPARVKGDDIFIDSSFISICVSPDHILCSRDCPETVDSQQSPDDGFTELHFNTLSEEPDDSQDHVSTTTIMLNDVWIDDSDCSRVGSISFSPARSSDFGSEHIVPSPYSEIGDEMLLEHPRHDGEELDIIIR
uniref:Protein UL34 n=1 Tax=Cardioderma bat herpesvirus TaxID=3141914 RepID=A0AAU7E108_9VIRU